MKLEPFNFSQNITENELLEHIRYYYTMAHIAIITSKTNKKEAMNIYKEIRNNLDIEYKEYQKAKKRDYIRNSKLYIQYVDNITNACIKPTRVTAYDSLNGNLYDVQDYIDNGFESFLDMNREDIIDENNIYNYLGKICNVITRDYLVYQGMIDSKIFESISDKRKKAISIFDFEQWNRIDIENIRALKIIKNKE